MATKKAPVRASRSAPARAPSTPKPAAALPTPAPDGTVVLAHHGGATLSFRDGSGAKRRVLRGAPFTVDAATAELLLATDPAVHPADPEPESVEVTFTTAPVQVVAEPMPIAEASATGETIPLPPPAAEVPPVGPGAITLGDLPPGGRIGRP